MNLRPATTTDSHVLWEWANDAQTRAKSFRPAPILRDEHERWLKAVLGDPARSLYIAEIGNGTPIGQCRFDTDGRTATISISIASSHRGKGLGTDLIRSASRMMFETGKADRIEALVRPENRTSHRSFLRAGFRDVGPRIVKGIHARRLILHASTLPPHLTIGGRRIGPGEPVYLVAEMSANHGKDFDRAIRILEAAKAAGADAVKLQTYTADTLTIDSDAPPFRIGTGTLWEGRTLHDLYGEASTPWDWYPRLKPVAERLGLDLFSTPFDATAVDFLDRQNVPAHKIASFEIVDLELVRKVAATGKPTILSTGMATIEEIDEAVTAFRKAGGTQLALLKCTSAYPSEASDMHLRTIPDLAARFGVPVGLSDHTMDLAVPVAAVSLGASIVEKHVTLSRKDPGPDSPFSLEPEEFKRMADAVRTAEAALGDPRYGPSERETPSLVFRRSLFVVQDIKRGDTFTRENVRCIRPGNGLPPKRLPEILGKRAARDLPRGTPLSDDAILD